MLLCVCVGSGSVLVLSLVPSFAISGFCDYVTIFVRTDLDWFDWSLSTCSSLVCAFCF